MYYFQLYFYIIILALAITVFWWALIYSLKKRGDGKPLYRFRQVLAFLILPFATVIVFSMNGKLISDIWTGPQRICGKYTYHTERFSLKRSTSSQWIELKIDTDQTYSVDQNNENSDFLVSLKSGDTICMKYYPSLGKGFDLVKK